MSVDSLIAHSNRIAALEQEVALLRRVYEHSRAVLRFNGISSVRVAESLRELDDAIEKVKEFDGGTLDLNEEQLPRWPMNRQNSNRLRDQLGFHSMTDGRFHSIVAAVETHHGITVTRETEKPSTEYVGDGMYKGQMLSQAAVAWAQHCHANGEETLCDFLRHVALFAEQHEPNGSQAYYWRLYMLADAYESGIGHGIQRDGHDNADGTLYGGKYAFELNVMYRIGYKQGEKRRAAEERKAKEATPKPFAAAGKWFPMDITMRYPMREYMPGHWERAHWPSEFKEPKEKK